MANRYYMTEQRQARIRDLHAQFCTDQEIADGIGMCVSTVKIWRDVLKLDTHYPRGGRPRRPAKPAEPTAKVETRERLCIGGCGETHDMPKGRFTCDACYARNSNAGSSMGFEGSDGGQVLRYAGQR